ncbi:hypothetical protein G7075_04565 [Phycicoccus sp. HDW14]|uniref:ABC transporter permease n=1 Tax=Phycicoccus sp. HDW14 TaxID=2714941 RepID=UPI001408B25B|nr:hypothetical protein [Phycicoccus sp. HDW14]QIM20587.1 hypothetical protein G7075_04565 [Phycicoccus sp. HDW14]
MTGLGAALGIQWRTRRRLAGLWLVALVGSLWATATSVAGLYDSPAKVATYSGAVATDALVAINGRVAGIDTLGGIVQDEFAFVAAVLLPLCGIALVAGSTRREEESGRLEQLLAGRMDRRAPLVASLLGVLAVVALVVAGGVGALVSSGLPVAGSLLYVAALGGLMLLFAALAAVLGQVVLHARGVYAGSLAVLGLAYVVRGVGDVEGWWLAWLSPLTWVERAEPFAGQRWWVLAVPLAGAALLAGAAVVLAGRRDLGSARWRAGAGPGRAGALLRHPVGLALVVHRGSLAGWLTGAVVLAAVMGSLAQEVVAAIEGNPALSGYLAISGGDPADGFLAVVVLFLTVVAVGYVVQAVGTLRREETEGRLEPQLAGTTSRWRWLGAQLVVVGGGLVAVLGASSLVLGLTTARSTGEESYLWSLPAAGLAFVPAVLVVLGAALALFGVAPRAYPLAWVVVGLVAFVALLGTGLQLPGWVLDLSPTTHVGTPPDGAVARPALLVLTLVAAALAGTGFAGFRRRLVPRG